MKIRPISQYTIIKLDPADEKLGDTGLIAPGAVLQKYNVPKRTGTVKAVGRGLVTAMGNIVPPQVVPGDRVYVLEAKVEITVEYDGDVCLVLSDESHIIGVIED